MDLDDLYNAWYDEGRVPEYHRMMKEKLQREWPVLYEAIVTTLEKQYGKA